MAQDSIIAPSTPVPMRSKELSGDHHQTPPEAQVACTKAEYKITDLYMIEGLEVERRKEVAVKPFTHKVQIHGPAGEIT